MQRNFQTCQGHMCARRATKKVTATKPGQSSGFWKLCEGCAARKVHSFEGAGYTVLVRPLEKEKK